MLNELDWWIANQWEKLPTRQRYTRAKNEPDKSKLKLTATALLLDKRQVEKLIVLNNLAVKVS